MQSKSHVSIKAGASQSVMVIFKIWIGFQSGKSKKKKMPTETAIKFFETSQFSRVGRERTVILTFFCSIMFSEQHSADV